MCVCVCVFLYFFSLDIDLRCNNSFKKKWAITFLTYSFPKNSNKEEENQIQQQ